MRVKTKRFDFNRVAVLTFDCYGTLIDWESGICEALQPVLRRHGVALAGEKLLEKYAACEAAAEQGEFRKYRQVLQSVLVQLGRELGFEPSPAELQAFPESIRHWRPFPDTVAALRGLKSRFRLGIISNVDDDLFAYSAALLQVPFDWVITAEQAGAYKPSPAIFQHALRIIGVPAGQILHVAQSLYHDHVPARMIGIGLRTVWVNRRRGKTGSGATPAAAATPDLEVPDLRTLAALAN